MDSLFGVGLLKEHMQLNPLLTDFQHMDLNTPSLRLPLESCTFDAVVCNTLPYLTAPKQVLAEARRCVKEDGVVVMSWSSSSKHESKMTEAWRQLTGSVPCSCCCIAFSVSCVGLL